MHARAHTYTEGGRELERERIIFHLHSHFFLVSTAHPNNFLALKLALFKATHGLHVANSVIFIYINNRNMKQWFSSFKYYLFLFFIYECLLALYMLYACRIQKSHRFPRTGVMGICEFPYRSWEPNLGLLPKQQVLLTAWTISSPFFHLLDWPLWIFRTGQLLPFWSEHVSVLGVRPALLSRFFSLLWLSVLLCFWHRVLWNHYVDQVGVKSQVLLPLSHSKFLDQRCVPLISGWWKVSLLAYTQCVLSYLLKL